MFSRIAGQSLMRASRASVAAGTSRAFSKSVPLVSDKTINVTFIDYKADKFTVAAPVGLTLYQVARTHKLDFLVDDSQGTGTPLFKKNSDTWTEDTYGTGVSSNIAHVVLPDKWYETFPPPYPDEVDQVSKLEDKIRDPRSRLATELVLEKKHDGLTVFVPDHLPIDWV
jgi:hypothetical protein